MSGLWWYQRSLRQVGKISCSLFKQNDEVGLLVIGDW
jgi:hypothetical protein